MENVIVGVAVVIAAIVVGRMIYAAVTGKKGSSCGGCCDHGARDTGDSGPPSDRCERDDKDAQV